MRFGAHVNAHTSFDETVYQLQIPTDSRAVIDRSLLIMEDWAHNVSFEPAAIEKERGVVLEEWRLGLGAESRLRDAQMPILLKGARYADRSPIGRPEIIQNVSPARLRQFYTDWYRPDLMAVIAVGDFDPAAIEVDDRRSFRADSGGRGAEGADDLHGPAARRHALLAGRRPRGDRHHRHRVQRDAGRRSAHGRDLSAADGRTPVRAPACRRGSTKSPMRPDAPFIAAQTNRGLFVRSAIVTTLAALVPDGGAERGLEALFTEAERVVRYGFTPTELDREKLDSQRYLDRGAAREGQEPVGSARRRTGAPRGSGRAGSRHRLRTGDVGSGSCRKSRSPKSTRWRARGSPRAIASWR